MDSRLSSSSPLNRWSNGGVKSWLVLAASALGAMGCSGVESSTNSTGGSLAVGGSLSSTGGTGTMMSQGGMNSSGGSANHTGGNSTALSQTGGAPSVGGQGPISGGAASTGGIDVTGGLAAAGGGKPTGGAAGTAGNSATGGNDVAGGSTTGGVFATGGSLPATGGKSSTGGKSATGGALSSGGTSATGGLASTGGTTAAGSSTSPAHVCDEPAPWSVPTTNQIVGTGTPASCTATALRTAVTAGGNVTFNCGAAPVSITIPSMIQVSKVTVVDGGTGSITLDGGGTSQIFVVSSNYSLSVRNLRFINGKAPAVATDATGIGGAVAGNWRSKIEVRNCTFEDNVAGRGGGAVSVWTGSSLTVVSSRFLRNHSWYGGAIYTLLSPLQVTNCEFTDNSTLTDQGTGDGGAIGTDGASESTTDTVGGTVQICGTQIRNSQGYGNGGGAYIWVYPPDLVVIDRTTVEGNKIAKNGKSGNCLGGAMRISNGEIIIKDSSLLSNTSDNSGGAFYLDCAPTCTITNSTFYANKAAGYGGAIFSGTSSGQISANNVTFASNNQQNTQGNALFGSATWVLNNSIFLDNSCASSGTGAHVLQWLTSSKSAGTGPCIAGVTATDPKLAAPADNGGPTFTMLPATGSGALQAGASCEATDQRGQTRVVATCDVGSVEVP